MVRRIGRREARFAGPGRRVFVGTPGKAERATANCPEGCTSRSRRRQNRNTVESVTLAKVLVPSGRMVSVIMAAPADSVAPAVPVPQPGFATPSGKASRSLTARKSPARRLPQAVSRTERAITNVLRIIRSRCPPSKVRDPPPTGLLRPPSWFLNLPRFALRLLLTLVFAKRLDPSEERRSDISCGTREALAVGALIDAEAGDGPFGVGVAAGLVPCAS